jgi:hypothetical protein
MGGVGTHMYNKSFSFLDKWCSWVKPILVGGTISVKFNNKIRTNSKNNNEVGTYFTSSKGGKQSDPLSPTLFNLVVESLTKMLLNAQENGLLVGWLLILLQMGLLYFSMLITL